MSEDRLKEIKWKNQFGNYPDVNWLISELEQSRAAMAEVRRLWEITIDRAEKAEAEVKRLRSILANQGQVF